MSTPDPTVYTSAEIYRAYLATFLTPAGQVVLEDLKRACHLYSGLITAPGVIDPMQMAIAEGERNAILRVLAILQSKEEDYVTGNGARE